MTPAVSLPFDALGDAQLAESLPLHSTEALGRDLARRCKLAMDAAEGARNTSTGSRDLVVLASAAETSHEAAAWTGRFSTAVTALIGMADVSLVQECARSYRKALGHAAVCASRWQVAKREKAGAAWRT